MWETIQKQWQAKAAILIFLLFTLWWITNQYILDPKSVRYDVFGDFGDVYGFMALWGGLWGIVISKKWGFTQSVMGKAILMFSLGLFAQEFGQISYSLYYNLTGVPGPYPSIGDLGFFGSIFFYMYGVWLLGQASGIHLKLQLYKSKIQAIIIPAIMLFVAYYLFLQNYTFDWANPIKIILDFGYPFGQAIYISLAILVYFLSRDILGGVMKDKILFILFALWIQFLSDYFFLYQSSHGTYAVGGIIDYMYLLSYFAMTLGLLQLNNVLIKLRGEK